MAINDDLISYWKLDEISGTSATDSHSSNNGTASNAAIFTAETAGIINTGADFSTGNHKIDVSAGIASKTTGSISFWMKSSDTASDFTVLQVDSTDNVVTGAVGLYNSGTRFGIWPHDSTGGAGFICLSNSDTDALLNNQWHMVTITFTGTASTTKIYVDGRLKVVEQLNSYTSNPRIEGNFVMGVRRDGSGYYGGQLDEVAMWERELSISEIESLYLVQKTGIAEASYDTFSFGDGWQYRKKITIEGSSGASTNYPVLLLVGESSGSTADFHVEGNSESFPTGKDVGGDLLFTSSDGETVIPFWVESVTGSTPNRTAKIWVKVTEDLDTDKDIYIYYGNDSATNQSNGDNTFSFFDDFPGSSLDTSKWDEIVGGNAVSSSVLTVTGNDFNSMRGVKAKTSFNSGYMWESNMNDVEPASNRYIYSGFFKDFTFAARDSDPRAGLTIRDISQANTRQTSTTSTTLTFTPATRQVRKVQWTSGSEVKFYEVDTLRATHTTNIPTDDLKPTFAVQATSTGKMEVDWVFVRKFIATEPSFDSAGVQEDTGAVTYTITIGITGNGTVSKDPDKEEYDENEEVELTAVPTNGNSRFRDWSGDEESTSNPIVVTMDANKNIDVYFETKVSTTPDGTVTF